MTWSLARAKDNLSEVVRSAAEEGPQSITIRGRKAAVVLSQEDYDRLTGPERPVDFKTFLLAIPNLDDLDLERDRSPARDVEF